MQLQWNNRYGFSNLSECMMKRFDRLLLLIEAIKNILEKLLNGGLSPQKEKLQADDLLTSKEVQSLFGIVHSTYYRWIDRKWLDPIIIGGKHYHRRDDIQSLLEKRKYRERGGLN
ncbi:MAG: Helix-turn-helix domain [Sphingobacterium sp.]|jgi:predicted DNA-binding transcriptional regulator AlpA|nr:Helix-turn-helix domain [Sphingobacterium sp.]